MQQFGCTLHDVKLVDLDWEADDVCLLVCNGWLSYKNKKQTPTFQEHFLFNMSIILISKLTHGSSYAINGLEMMMKCPTMR